MKRLIALLLLTCVLGGLLCGCATGNVPTDTSVKDPDQGILAGTEAALDIPDDRYDDQQLIFLTREDGEWGTVEIFAPDGSGDNISNAVFERNDMIKQKYGVDIAEFRQGSDKHQNTVNKEVSAPTGDFQVIVSSVTATGNMVMNNLLVDLNSDENLYLDTEKPWWDTRFAHGTEIDGKLFFVTGDIMTLDNDATFAIMFNKGLAKDVNLPNLYSMVKNQNWTMDKMYEFAQLAKSDKNGDGKLDYKGDVSGFAYTVDTPYCILYAGGVQVVGSDDKGELIYALDIDRTQSIAEMSRMLLNSAYSTNLNGNSDGAPIVEAGKTCFGGGYALFFGECLQCVTRLRSYDTEFGILPYPMYDSNQDGYRSLMHSTGSVVSIPKSIAGTDQIHMVTSMLEAMACYSVSTLTEQYYEINLKSKGAHDAESAEMIDLIIGNRACDLAYYYGWGDVVQELSGALLPGSGTSVASSSASYKRNVEKSIERMISAINKTK